jgi:hypothetical protein
MALISSGPATNGAYWFESPGGYQRLFAFTGSLGHHRQSREEIARKMPITHVLQGLALVVFGLFLLLGP